MLIWISSTYLELWECLGASEPNPELDAWRHPLRALLFDNVLHEKEYWTYYIVEVRE